jgi:hypothetical protein
MELALIRPPDAEAKSTGSQPAAPKKRKRRGKWTPRPRPLSRASLDGRTAAAKLFDKLAADIATDLGGRDQLSTIEVCLIEGFAGAYVGLANINTKLALGQAIDLGEMSGAISSLVRVAQRLGTSKRIRDITPSLSDYLKAHEQREPVP